MLTAILNQEALTDRETILVAEVLSDPLIKRYLRIMGQNDLAELAVLSITERNDSEVAKKHALIQGKLSTIATLLSITKPD